MRSRSMGKTHSQPGQSPGWIGGTSIAEIYSRKAVG
jgi:hypothetical protein